MNPHLSRPIEAVGLTLQEFDGGEQALTPVDLKNDLLIRDGFASPSLARMLISDSEKEKRRLASSFGTNSALMSY